jgi:succinate dehydrogenase/fumarate reductase flavoprotein subunit
VVAEHKEKYIHIKAKKAVILCNGGFQANSEIRLNFLPAPLEFTGTPHNTGDGIYMAAKAGAKLWHMAYFAGLMRIFKLPCYSYNALITPPGGLRYI